MPLLLVLLGVLCTSFASYTNYDGSKLVRIIPKSQEHLDFLNFAEHTENYDFLCKVRAINVSLKVMIPGEALESFWEAADRLRLNYKILLNNTQRIISDKRNRQLSTSKIKDGQITFNKYLRYDEIVAYLRRLASDYPKIAVLEEFGTSYEGRPLYVLRIGTKGQLKSSILIDGGIHAREWISAAVTLYIIRQLVEISANYEMVSKVNWVIVVVLNPDGYEYSHTTNRFWRKTRSVGEKYIGVDMNRNFDFHWMGPGTSDNECSDTFGGPYAFSEPEALAFSRLALSISNISLYLGVHNYGSLLLYPWGFTTDLPDNAGELQAIGERVAAAMEAVNGTAYRIGTSPNLTYYVSGTTKEWVMGVAGAKLSYVIELPRGGSMGFDLPTERILPVCKETWPGIVELYKYITENV